MKYKYLDMVGKRFGKLTVDKVYKVDDKAYCDCSCDCGNKCTKVCANVYYGYTKSCGCLARESKQEVSIHEQDKYIDLYKRIEAGETITDVARDSGIISRQSLNKHYLRWKNRVDNGEQEVR